MIIKLQPVTAIEFVVAFLICFVCFLIGYLFSRRYYRNRYENELEEYKQKSKEEAPQTQESRIRAVKTMARKGEAIMGETDNLQMFKGVKASKGPKLELNFGSIGVASEAEKDDLKKISGIGPFIERKLNGIGVYTYKQISKFRDHDIDTVTQLIEFFPGRIKRDDWMKQAANLMKEQQQEQDE
ncbi:hypothetical protein GWK08_09900 [Leptobacterium flavescens]|uniref:Helix-hairpin-helix domain-containing protein n=1 Tax=Leptobacterium flavescens TaxID=472055 RepID=A0A6P0UMF2_9FLAO|nr:hypothetical protein [Leptobacterium flavescens]NER13752.1 hypothetical protein [Leptobacterium flavescens]